MNTKTAMMTSLRSKHIILGISGSIAAYKAPLLARELMKAGADVRVVMTPSATKFITPLTLENLTRQPVAVTMFDDAVQHNGSWHIHLARWCDLMMIAPCSAATLGRIAHGICDTALATVALALPPGKPLLLAPAMDTEMWIHPATQRNLRILREDGAIVIPPAEGELASGFSGIGRLPETSVLLDSIFLSLEGMMNTTHEQQKPSVEEQIRTATETPVVSLQEAIDQDRFTAELELEKLKSQQKPVPWKNKMVVITAGPTYQRIDDVRFIGNYSSGKMGFALAEQAHHLGAQVLLIAGPVALTTPPGVERIDVESAQEMFDACMKYIDKADAFVLAAAVADYTPATKQEGKIKKSAVGETMMLELRQTQDILASIGKRRHSHQVLIGFALEAENEVENAQRKLYEKNCDMIVLNSLHAQDSGFGGDNNTISILTRDGTLRSLPRMSKTECAKEILEQAAKLL